jgi:hypothetical protein
MAWPHAATVPFVAWLERGGRQALSGAVEDWSRGACGLCAVGIGEDSSATATPGYWLHLDWRKWVVRCLIARVGSMFASDCTPSAFFYSDGIPDLEFSFLILAGCFDQVGAHMEALTRSADSRHER